MNSNFYAKRGEGVGPMQESHNPNLARLYSAFPTEFSAYT